MAQDEDSTGAPIATPGPHSRRVLVVVWALVAFVVVGSLILGAAFVFGVVTYTRWAMSSASTAGPVLNAQWKARIAKDYPGWKLKTFETQDMSGSSGDGTYYTATLIPPGETHSLQIQYLSKNGGPAASQDEVFRSDGSFHMWSASLLGYLKRNYFNAGKRVDTVTSGEDAMVIVVWHYAKDEGDPSGIKSDILSYDSVDEVWRDEGP